MYVTTETPEYTVDTITDTMVDDFLKDRVLLGHDHDGSIRVQFNGMGPRMSLENARSLHVLLSGYLNRFDAGEYANPAD